MKNIERLDRAQSDHAVATRLFSSELVTIVDSAHLVRVLKRTLTEWTRRTVAESTVAGTNGHSANTDDCMLLLGVPRSCLDQQGFGMIPFVVYRYSLCRSIQIEKIQDSILATTVALLLCTRALYTVDIVCAISVRTSCLERCCTQ